MKPRILSGIFLFVIFCIVGIGFLMPAGVNADERIGWHDAMVSSYQTPNSLGSPGSWEQSNVDGFDHAGVPTILSMETFQGYLYVGNDSRAGGINRLMRSMNGADWEEIIEADSGRTYNYGIGSLAEFQGKLYAGTWYWNWEDNIAGGGELWRSDNGLDFTPVITNGFGTSTNNGISRLVVFNGRLYAFTGTYEDAGHMQLWHSSTGNTGEWQQVSSGPFAVLNNREATSVDIFQDQLYVGTYNEVTGGELWRSGNGTDWERIPLTDLSSATSAIATLETFGDRFYFGTRNPDNGGEIWHSTDGVAWTPVVESGFGNLDNGRLYDLVAWDSHLYVTATNEATGAEVWRSVDGLAWESLSEGGWGDKYNVGSYFDGTAMAFNNRLYIGINNGETGAELWRYTIYSMAHNIYLPLVRR